MWIEHVFVPFRLSVEQSAGGVDVDNLLVDQCSVAFLWILLGCIPEETAADGLLDSHCGFTAGHHIQFMSVGGEERSQRRWHVILFCHATRRRNPTCPWFPASVCGYPELCAGSEPGWSSRSTRGWKICCFSMSCIRPAGWGGLPQVGGTLPSSGLPRPACPVNTVDPLRNRARYNIHITAASRKQIIRKKLKIFCHSI